jgi:tRNA (guanine37-N1)-methyltransferase
VDERIREHLVTDEISIGDYVLTGGELPALVILDAVSRYLPGVLGDPTGAEDDSHASGYWNIHITPVRRYSEIGLYQMCCLRQSRGNHRWRVGAIHRTHPQKRPDILAKFSVKKTSFRIIICNQLYG